MLLTSCPHLDRNITCVVLTHRYNYCMSYKQPNEEEIALIRMEHAEQKAKWIEMERTTLYKENNWELNKQREYVRKLYDKILMFESYKNYPRLKKDFCMFFVNHQCAGEIKNTFNHWWVYGNCCLSCSAVMGKTATQLYSPVEDVLAEGQFYLPDYTESEPDELELSTIEAFEDVELDI